MLLRGWAERADGRSTNLGGFGAPVFIPEVETTSDFSVGRAANGFILGAEDNTKIKYETIYTGA